MNGFVQNFNVLIWESHRVEKKELLVLICFVDDLNYAVNISGSKAIAAKEIACSGDWNGEACFLHGPHYIFF